MERVRFSPAPSGLLHLGGARTALFNHLVAKQGGRFILRFEDTDAVRSDAAFEPSLLEDLAWLGLTWDEGPDVGGAFGPYRQSERTALYTDALRKLEATGHVYRCFCAEDRLAGHRDADAAEGRAPRYRGTCRTLDPEESAARAGSGVPFCWRFAVPHEGAVTVEDAVHGTVSFATEDIGDFLVARADGVVLYDLACACDDAAMGITLVIRGDDHLSNTARQIMLLRALGYRAPRYAHVPLVMGVDGRPLSKSRGAESVASLREAGYLPSAIVNHLALLGWSDPDGREVFPMGELVEAFTLQRVSSSAPIHDPARLRWLNRRHMAQLPLDERIGLIAPHVPPLPGAGPQVAARLIADDVDVAGDAPALLAGVAAPLDPDGEALSALASPFARIAMEVALSALSVEEPAADAVRSALKAAGLPLREALPAVRAALTGRAHGLPMSTLEVLIGAHECRHRLRGALSA